MDESLRQAYDYWQDQPGSTRRHASAYTSVPTVVSLKLKKIKLLPVSW